MAVFNNILNGASGQTAGGAGAGYEIERSLRFNGDTDNASLSKSDYSTDGNQRTFTFSFWIKKTKDSANQRLFGLGSQSFSIMLDGNGSLYFFGSLQEGGSCDFTSLNRLSDPSAWYHVVIAFDTTASTAEDRMRAYINGTEIAYNSNTSYPVQNRRLWWNTSTITHYIGRYSDNSLYFYNGYMAEVHFIDGQALAETDFGEFDANGVWQPKVYSGTYGTNGFHLDFSDNSSASALGTDSSGNSNNWTVSPNIDVTTAAAVNNEDYYKDGTGASQSASSGGTLPFDGSYTSYVNNSTGAITNTAWTGARLTSGTVIRWQPPTAIPISSSIDFYGGSRINTSVSYTLKIVYTDATSVTTTGASGTNNWVKRLNDTPTGKSLDYVEATCTGFAPFINGIRIDGVFIINTDATESDSMLDSPTNGTQEDTGAGGEVSGNYCTINTNHSTATILNGNLDVQVAASGHSNNYGTFGMSSGKWYWEVYRDTFNANSGTIGFHGSASASKKIGAIWAGPASNTDQHVFYFNATTSGILYNGQSGASFPFSGTSTPTLPTNWNTEGGYWMFCVDMDDHKAWIGKDGVWWGWTGSAYTTTGGDPANGLNPTFALNANDTYFPFNGAYDTAAGRYTYKHNFGQRPFAYTAPDKFKALCTANLDDPTILDGSTQMDSVLYTGDGTAGNTITGLNFAPDLVWLKVRATYSYNHELYDTVRGVGERLLPSGPNTEVYNANYLQQFNSDGFQLGSGSGQNTNNASYVSWTWKGGGTAVSNESGSIISSVSANPSAGFSIVSYTGTGGTGTVGHGLNDSPSMVWVKNRDNNTNWAVAHTGLSSNRCLYLNENYADTTVGFLGLNKSNFTSTTFTVNYSDTNTNVVNASSNKYIAYCWAPVEGYSAFGSLDPSGEPFIYTGFRPKFLLYKLSNTTGPWVIYDTERNPYNVADLYLQANSTATEATLAAWDFLSNGFKIKASFPSGTIVYAAFAENPFKTARAR